MLWILLKACLFEKMYYTAIIALSVTEIVNNELRKDPTFEGLLLE